MKIFKKPYLAVTALVVTITVGCLAWLSSSGRATPNGQPRVEFYQDSMHPWIKSDGPGKCTICGMDLTPIHTGEREFGADQNLVALSSNSITVLNVQTEEVKRHPLRFSLRVAGTLDADETRTAIFSAPAPGRIDEMAVESVGDEVEAEQRLFTFYSPELATWRRAYVIRNAATTLTTPFFAGRPHEGSDTSDRPKPRSPQPGRGKAGGGNDASDTDPYFSDLLSPLSGTVVERKVFNGQYVAEGDRLLTIVDTSMLWFRFDVYEHQLSWLKKGQEVRVTVAGAPGRDFAAVVAVIEPTVDEKTRTVKVRANLPNPAVKGGAAGRRLLQIGMYAEGRISSELPGVVTVPRSAVLSPGGQAVAYVEKGPGAYEMRAVKLGRQGDEQYEILEGLEEGDLVVTSGNVLIDAQAQLSCPGQGVPCSFEEGTGLARNGEECQEGMVVATVHTPQLSPRQDPVKLPSEPATGNAPSEQKIESHVLEAAHVSDADEASHRPAAVSRQAPRRISVGTPNNRHPEARERMARSFALGVGQKHRDQAGLSLVSNASAAEGDFSAGSVAPANANHSTTAPQTSGSPRDEGLTGAQRAALQSFLTVVGDISSALAADDLKSLKTELETLAKVSPPLAGAFPAAHPWHEVIEELTTESVRPTAESLEGARKGFTAFSGRLVTFAKQLRKEDAQFASYKIYHCPMAPKPGLWLQARGPLQNPFYGSQMLTCGEEVK